MPLQGGVGRQYHAGGTWVSQTQCKANMELGYCMEEESHDLARLQQQVSHAAEVPLHCGSNELLAAPELPLIQPNPGSASWPLSAAAALQ